MTVLRRAELVRAKPPLDGCAGSKVSQHALTAYARALVYVIESQYTAKQLPGYAGTDRNLALIPCGAAQPCCVACAFPSTHSEFSLCNLYILHHMHALRDTSRQMI